VTALRSLLSRIRLGLLVARPALVVLLGLFAAVGAAQGGRPEDPSVLTGPLLVVAAFLVAAVAVNDLSDEAIDRVNLGGDRRRPLVAGTAGRRDLAVVAAVAATTALLVATTLSWTAAAVTAAGLGLVVVYSVPPFRVCNRGVLAPLLLPAGYVGVPFVLGLTAARPSVHTADVVLLGGLYLGFIGRIVLKDFRDVRGDALYGKRTFLVRHGRAWTCAFSGVCWVAGLVALAGVRGTTGTLAVVYAVELAGALVLLRLLARSTAPKRDEALVAAIAIVGRGMVVTLLAHYSIHAMPASFYGGVLTALAVFTLGSAHAMAVAGPRTRLTVPAAWAPDASELATRGEFADDAVGATA
jgi:4-hydroxybenzoate polyprenyltransferase